MGKVYGIESHVLGPNETKELYPLMNVDDIYASLYSPCDGTIDPAGYCTGLTRVATRAGAKVRSIDPFPISAKLPCTCWLMPLGFFYQYNCLCDTSTTYIGKTKRHLAILSLR